ncbi:hypothetical protein QZH41_005096 [Actinostola sp. cb2023]|nr:hypothetical protein QZH41_005096 [Actinostola sp. cb2023]
MSGKPTARSYGHGNKASLHRHLFNAKKYSNRVRPAANASDSLNVTFGLALHEIIDLSSSADLSWFITNVEWKLLDIPGKFQSSMYACCPHPFHDIEYLVKMKRRSLFHAMYLIIPCAVISLLTLLVFVLPPECNERMTVGMTILVGLSFFFLLVAENMPATSDTVPVIGIYYSVTLLEVSAAFFMTCFVLMCHHHNPTDGDLPDWVRVSIERQLQKLREKRSKEKNQEQTCD